MNAQPYPPSRLSQTLPQLPRVDLPYPAAREFPHDGLLPSPAGAWGGHWLCKAPRALATSSACWTGRGRRCHDHERQNRSERRGVPRRCHHPRAATGRRAGAPRDCSGRSRHVRQAPLGPGAAWGETAGRWCSTAHATLQPGSTTPAPAGGRVAGRGPGAICSQRALVCQSRAVVRQE
jgi:hypothetical protein